MFESTIAPSASKDEFPSFSSGDVTITVSTSHTYRLHSHVLRRVSLFFRNILDTTIAPKLAAAARRKGCTPYRFVLVNVRDAVVDRCQFVSLAVSETGQFHPFCIPRTSTIELDGRDIDESWDWLFGCFYGIAPKFDESTFGTTVQDCSALLDVADVIGADTHVQEVVDRALLQQDETLWKSIAQDPAVWAELGSRVKSPSIFKEAVVHLIGKWKMLEPDSRHNLPKDIAVLCQLKWDELELAKRVVEIRIAGHYPESVCRMISTKTHRSTYSNDIYMWMAMSIFRQYIAQSGNDGQNRLASDGGYKWYKKIYEGGTTYLTHEDMSKFHDSCPMSSKAMAVLEQNMHELKNDMKIFVKDLMVVRTHMNPANLPEVDEPWLTCAVIRTQDLPWQIEPVSRN